MCPIHWAAFAFAAVPASLGLLGYLGLRLKRSGAGAGRGGVACRF